MIVKPVTTYQTVFVSDSGAVFQTRDDAYHHVACWRIKLRNERRRWPGGTIANAENTKLVDMDGILVARLARWLRWTDSRQT